MCTNLSGILTFLKMYSGSAGLMDHICFVSEDVDAVIEAAKAHGCISVPYKPAWFILPNGIVIEMKWK